MHNGCQAWALLLLLAAAGACSLDTSQSESCREHTDCQSGRICREERCVWFDAGADPDPAAGSSGRTTVRNEAGAGGAGSGAVPSAGMGPSESGAGSVAMPSGGMDASMDAGMDANIDAGMDAMPPDRDAHVDEDATVSEAGADDDTGTGPEPLPEPNLDPCSNGTFRCVPLKITVNLDFFSALSAAATVSVNVDGYTFEALTQAGIAQLQVPAGRWMLAEARLDGFWGNAAPILVPAGAQEVSVPMSVFTHELLTSSVVQIGVAADDSKGFVFATFVPKVVGLGIDLGRTSGPSYVGHAWMFMTSDRLVENADATLHFPNVEPGLLTPAPIAPPGYVCITTDQGTVPYVLKPKTVLQLDLWCLATGP